MNDLIESLRDSAQQHAHSLPGNPQRLREVHAGITRVRRRRAATGAGVVVAAVAAVALALPGAGALRTTPQPVPPARPDVPVVQSQVAQSQVAQSGAAQSGSGESEVTKDGLPRYVDGSRLVATTILTVTGADAGKVLSRTITVPVGPNGTALAPRVLCSIQGEGSASQDATITLSWGKGLGELGRGSCSEGTDFGGVTPLSVSGSSSTDVTLSVGRAVAGDNAGTPGPALKPLPSGLNLRIAVGTYEEVASRSDYVFPARPADWTSQVTNPLGATTTPRGRDVLLLDEAVTSGTGEQEFSVRVPATRGKAVSLEVSVVTDAPGQVLVDVNGVGLARVESWDWTPRETKTLAELRISTTLPPGTTPKAQNGPLVFGSDTTTYTVHVKGSQFLAPGWRVVVTDVTP